MPFIIIWTKNAKKDLEKLERQIAKRIFEKIENANNTDSLLLEKVKGESFFKYRVGKFRAFIDKSPDGKTLFIISIRHRKKAYKNL